MQQFRLNSELRQKFDVVRPDSDDLLDPQLEPVASALAESAECRTLFEKQQVFDRVLANVIADVEPPEGFQQRLLSVLADARESHVDPGVPECIDNSEELTEPARDETPAIRRRNWLIAAGALAASLVLGLALWNRGPAQLTLNEIRQLIPLSTDGRIEVSGLSPFDGAFQLQLPSGRWDRMTLSEPLGLDWSGDRKHDAAIVAFAAEGKSPVQGYLLILPASDVADLPTRTFLSAAEMSYVPTDNAAAINTSGDLVYMCFVEPGKLPTLQRVLYPQSA